MILELYNAMYRVDRSVEDFRWLNEKNPAGKATLFIALCDGKVVGMQSLVPYVFLRNGEPIKTYKSEDTLVDKKYRGIGIFSRLYDMVHEYAGETMVWGLTDKNVILERVKMPSSSRLTIALSVRRPTIVYDKKGLHRMMAKTLYYSFLYFKSKIKGVRARSKYRQTRLESSDYGQSEFQDFFKRLSVQNPNLLIPRMDQDYLTWRLTQNPNFESYDVEVSHDEHGTVVMCSIVGYTGSSAHWLAFYADEAIEEVDRVSHIIARRRRLYEQGVLMVHVWLFECNALVKNVKSIFHKAGFCKVREGLWIVHNSTGRSINVHDLYFSGQLGIR